MVCFLNRDRSWRHGPTKSSLRLSPFAPRAPTPLWRQACDPLKEVWLLTTPVAGDRLEEVATHTAITADSYWRSPWMILLCHSTMCWRSAMTANHSWRKVLPAALNGLAQNNRYRGTLALALINRNNHLTLTQSPTQHASYQAVSALFSFPTRCLTELETFPCLLTSRTRWTPKRDIAFGLK